MPGLTRSIPTNPPGATAPPAPAPTAHHGRVPLGRLTRLFAAPPAPRQCRCRDPFGEVEEGADEVVLDVRGLPLEGQEGRTLERMEVLPAGARLRHVNDLVPWSLFAMLETRGYRYRLVGWKAGAVHVLIWGSAPAR